MNFKFGTELANMHGKVDAKGIQLKINITAESDYFVLLLTLLQTDSNQAQIDNYHHVTPNKAGARSGFFVGCFPLHLQGPVETFA